MIDTNELRARANATENKFPYLQAICFAAADELDRLYELERRTTPLTREEIEAELAKRFSGVVREMGYITRYGVTTGTYVDIRTNINSEFLLVVKNGFVVANILLPRVTLQLLDAVLEVANAN